jgi:hypothetical protein
MGDDKVPDGERVMKKHKICETCQRQREAQEEDMRCMLWEEYKSLKRGYCLAYEPVDEREPEYYSEVYAEWN